MTHDLGDKAKEIWRLSVGEPYAPGVTYGGIDRFEYRYTNGQHMLQCLLGKLTERDVAAFLSGEIRVGLYTRKDTIFFLFRIAGLYDWSDQAFGIHRLPPSDREVKPALPREQILLTVVLVDSDTGLVRGLRAVTYSAHMSELFQRLIARQVQNGLTEEQHEENVAATYAQFRDSKEMVKAALVLERAGLKHA